MLYIVPRVHNKMLSYSIECLGFLTKYIINNREHFIHELKSVKTNIIENSNDDILLTKT